MNDRLLTLWGLGRLRYSGSIASLIATLFYSIPLFLLPPWVLGLTALVMIFLVVYSFARLHKYRGEVPEVKKIVVDEFTGTWFCLFCAFPDNMDDVLFLFLIFRTLDLIKVPPFSWIETTLPQRWGIMAGDLSIGITVGLLYGLLM